ncbi:hypothetical protein [Flavobacterium sp. 102]|uniref:hypothetical protein n=1 Tax=Flavobacterium sp. 102 TaxID=2135623 RepID=UPI000EB48752|nr:hypothetical protein [Flavobacterium sp. 102]RKS02806.1 hypothetical protein C8C84_2535 [Flavobacterium sp. 102]
MKRVFSLLILLALFSCKKTEETEIPAEEIVVTDSLITEKPSELFGTIYRNITEVASLKEYEHQAGSIIEKVKDANGDYKYGLSQYGNDKNYILLFDELIREANNPKPKYKILDTLNISKLSIEENIAICTCRHNKIPDSEIIAIVKSQANDGIEFYTNIVKAWRADTKTQKIVPIEDLKGIDCINEGYGL